MEGSGTPVDLIGQGLRLPPDMNVVVDVVKGMWVGRQLGYIHRDICPRKEPNKRPCGAASLPKHVRTW